MVAAQGGALRFANPVRVLAVAVPAALPVVLPVRAAVMMAVFAYSVWARGLRAGCAWTPASADFPPEFPVQCAARFAAAAL